MPRSSRITCDCVFRVFVPVCFAMGVLSVLGVFPERHSVPEEIWTADDLSSMAQSNTMAAAVSSLRRAARQSGEHEIILDEIEKLIDLSTAAKLRGAILRVTDGSTDDKFAKFARTTSAAATCSTEGTAGRHGLDLCLADCEEKRSFLARTPRTGACYMLCSLANSPCTNDLSRGTTPRRPVSWGTMKTGWWIHLSIWIGIVARWTAMTLDTMTSWIKLAAKRTTWKTATSVKNMVGFLVVVYCAYTARQRQKAAQRKEGRRKLDQMFEAHERLINQDGPFSLKEDLSSTRISRDSVKGGQR